MSLGEYTSAVEDFAAVILSDGRDVAALAWRAYAREKLGDHAGALADLDRAIDQDAQRPWLFVARAHARSLLNDHAGSLADLDVAVRLTEGKPAELLADRAPVSSLRHRGRGDPTMKDHATPPDSAPEERKNIDIVRDYMQIAYMPGKASAKAVAHLCAPGNRFIAPTTFPGVNTLEDYAEDHGEHGPTAAQGTHGGLRRSGLPAPDGRARERPCQIREDEEGSPEVDDAETDEGPRISIGHEDVMEGSLAPREVATATAPGNVRPDRAATPVLPSKTGNATSADGP